MSFTGKEGSPITLEEAQEMIGRYRTKYITEQGSEIPNNTVSVFMGREIIQRILDQENCVGIRAYYGEIDGYQGLVWVGVEESEDDMIEGIIADRGKVCPPDCGSVKTLSPK